MTAPAVSITNVLANGGAPSSGSNVTASWTPGTTKQYLLAINAYVSTGSVAPAISSVSGNGLTWTLIDTVNPDNLGADQSKIWLYAARGGGGSAGAITVSWSTAPSRASWSLDEVTNGDIGLGAGSLAQAVADATSSAANPSVTLGSSLKTGSVTYAVAGFESSTGTLSPGTGFTALGTVTTQSLAWLMTEWDSAGSTTASASNTTTSNRHGIIAIEIACAKFAPVGSSFIWDTSPVTFTPPAGADFVIVAALTKIATSPVLTGISSSNATWKKITGDFTGTNSNSASNIWIGKITSASAASVTLTWSGAGTEPAHWQIEGMGFCSVYSDWFADKQGSIDFNSSNSAYASLTPSNSGELYFGSHYDEATIVAGTTPGYTYVIDTHGNGILYNPACTASTQSPAWTDTTVWGGPMAMVNGLVSGTADVKLKKMTVSASDGLYTVWHDKLPDATTTSTGTGQRNDSLVFTVSQTCRLKGIAFYVPAVCNTVGSNYTAALYTTVTGTSGTLVTSQVGSGTFVNGAWNWIPFDVTLQPGTTYSAVINHPDALQFEHNWWGTGGPGASGLTDGPIQVPGQSAAPGNVQQGFLAGPLAFPGVSNSNGSWYGIDVKVSTNPVTSDTGTASVTLKKMTVSATGNIKVPGTASVTLKKMTAAASGTEIDRGTASVTLKKMTVTASGNIKIPGTVSVTLKKMTVSATGSVPITGAVSVTMRKMVVVAAGNIKIPGTASVTLRKMQVHASDGHASGASSLFIFSQL